MAARLAGASVALALLVQPSHAQRIATSDPSAVSLPPLKVVDPSYIDTAANACTDFFEYANGLWFKRDTIPADYSATGVFRDMRERNEVVVRSVLDSAMARRSTLPASSTEHKLGTFYASCIDSAAAEREGVSPVRPMLARIDSIRTRSQLLDAITQLQTQGSNVVLEYSPLADPHDAAHYIVWLGQGGLGLPDRDYYTDSSAAGDSLRQAYLQHIAKLSTLAGEEAAQASIDAGRVLALESQLAAASLTQVALREPSATDHAMSAAQLHSLAPAIEWPAYFHRIGLATPPRKLNVAEPAFLEKVNELIRTLPLEDWRAYLRYHALASASPWLSTPFVAENLAFTSRFSGITMLPPRWKRCLRVTNARMGEALGEAYVAQTFPPEARAKAKALIDAIRQAFGERVRRLTWMTDSTRTQALVKLAAVREKIGYPDRWRDYSKLTVVDEPFVLNVQRANEFEWHRVVNRPGTPVDIGEWQMTVPTVNAYYDPSKNEIVFPAGALVPQTFDPMADDGANYGSLGASWAGHELTHGFDDEGRHYDAAGNLRDWWTSTDSAEFVRRADVMVRQYNGYIQVDTFHVNGALTLGENIADYGGVLTAYDALEAALSRNGRPGKIDGYTPEQRFFLGYAQSFRTHVRPEQLKTDVRVDPHSPDRWRVIGPLSDVPAFATAFNCKPGDPMVRPDSLVPHIW